jgi:hypothetical protein
MKAKVVLEKKNTGSFEEYRSPLHCAMHFKVRQSCCHGPSVLVHERSQ